LPVDADVLLFFGVFVPPLLEALVAFFAIGSISLFQASTHSGRECILTAPGKLAHNVSAPYR
jgi:hypothetical protein